MAVAAAEASKGIGNTTADQRADSNFVCLSLVSRRTSL
jgi:hypothetical protein